MEGWVKIHRKVQEHWIWKTEPYFKGWITILFSVNFEDKKIYVEGELLDCKRGQSLMSLSNWASVLGKGWTVQKVRTFFDLLKNDGMINTEGLRKTTRLTVCNYDLWQGEQQAEKNKITSRQHADNTQNNTQTTRKITRQTDSDTDNYEDEQQTDNTTDNNEDVENVTTTKEYKNIKKENNIKEKKETEEERVRREVALKYFTEEVYEVIKNEDFFLDRYKQAEGHFDEVDAHEVNRTRIVRFGLTDTESKHEKEEYEKRDAKFLEDLVAGKFD